MSTSGKEGQVWRACQQPGARRPQAAHAVLCSSWSYIHPTPCSVSGHGCLRVSAVAIPCFRPVLMRRLLLFCNHAVVYLPIVSFLRGLSVLVMRFKRDNELRLLLNAPGCCQPTTRTGRCVTSRTGRHAAFRSVARPARSASAPFRCTFSRPADTHVQSCCARRPGADEKRSVLSLLS